MRAAILPFVLLLVLAVSASLGAPAPSLAQAPQTIPITVVVRGLRDDRGHVRIGLYSDANGWLRDASTVSRCIAEVHHGVARCVLQAPRAGHYAFAFLHDEDDDREMDKDALGFPQEGYGFSNDVRPGLGGAPSFASASFAVTGPVEQHATAKYGI